MAREVGDMDVCALEEVVELIGDRWSLLLVGVLLSGPRRTTELATILAPISTRTLAERLKRLEAAGVLTRRAYPEAPPRVEYQLTQRGLGLKAVLAALRDVASAWDGDCERVACRVCDVHRADEPTLRRETAPPVRRTTPVDITLL
jgi:DNA-binding HxlR family transcriptional regulator